MGSLIYVACVVVAFLAIALLMARTAWDRGGDPGPLTADTREPRPSPAPDVNAAVRAAVWELHGPLMYGALEGLRDALEPEGELAPRLIRHMDPDWTGRVEGAYRGRPVRASVRPGLSPEAPISVELELGDLRGVSYLFVDRATFQRMDATLFPPVALRLISDTPVRRLVSALLNEEGAASLELGAEARLCLELAPKRWREALDREPPAGTRRSHPYRARAGAQMVRWLEVLERLARAAEASSGVVGVETPGVRVDARPSDPICPYCRDDVGDEDSRACTVCETRHHAACWEEAGGCTLLGCRGRPRQAQRERG
jgi:hypothetical protein